MTDADLLDELRVWHKERFVECHKRIRHARGKRDVWKAQSEFHRRATLLLETIQGGRYVSLSDLDRKLEEFP